MMLRGARNICRAKPDIPSRVGPVAAARAPSGDHEMVLSIAVSLQSPMESMPTKPKVARA